MLSSITSLPPVDGGSILHPFVLDRNDVGLPTGRTVVIVSFELRAAVDTPVRERVVIVDDPENLTEAREQTHYLCLPCSGNKYRVFE